ncbi:Proline-rich receptor-like protein kinase perk15 [Thalictrum thalictroides]|uniref:non-specific serine/threonine protein kinase n=1 Tax=Thalictrum thalictroides TaxID=46969 RepID=A0A7J6X191_THATH|nr:Proline-rich receptor-like protein kinase perk15 [Thalictrum thalictroides]
MSYNVASPPLPPSDDHHHDFSDFANSPDSNHHQQYNTSPVRQASLFFIALGILIVLVVVWCCKRKGKMKKHDGKLDNQQPSGGSQGDAANLEIVCVGDAGTSIPASVPSKGTFKYDDLSAATNKFSQDNFLGQGGFGQVHKGVLGNGMEIAVKCLKSGSVQEEGEFEAEVENISRVQHPNLMSLLGYCITSEQRILVYEFIPNKTLEYHLHENESQTLDWSKRMMIAVNCAKGLAYLHDDCEPRVIHRDIKSANIHLKNDYEPLMADFGLAKVTADNITHVSTRIMGTMGYLAPEYAMSGKLTERSDVYSFGIVLLELITGRRPSAKSENLVDWARPLLMTNTLRNGDYSKLVDQRLENEYKYDEMECMIACAAASIRHSSKKRPTMSQVVAALQGDVSILQEFNVGIKFNQRSKEENI